MQVIHQGALAFREAIGRYDAPQRRSDVTGNRACDRAAPLLVFTWAFDVESANSYNGRAMVRNSSLLSSSRSHCRRLIAVGWPPLLFLCAAVYLFRDAIFAGRVFFENDTVLFYYPIARFIDSALQHGRLPLWVPYIFAGHPLFADGESGMLYPPNFIAYLLLPTSQASIVLRVLRFFLAALFAYLYGRSLKVQRPAAVVMGLAFAYGSFMVGQLHHTNVGTTALWLPMILTAVERALRASPRSRVAYVVLAGAALGSATLTVHVNPLLMMLVLLSLYVPFRVIFCPDVAPPGIRAKLRRVLFVLVLPVSVGLALGAVQLLPLWELGTFSRGRGVGYDFATGFALPPANTITAIFPYFFRDASDAYWSPWFRWDTTLYVGIAPLALAAMAAMRLRNRLTYFYITLGLIGLALAFGDYLPIKFYGLLWDTPLFSFVRGPARFLYWTTFALAVLAGLGMQELSRSLHMPTASSNRHWWRASVAPPWLGRTLLGIGFFTTALACALAIAFYLTGQEPQAAKDLLQKGYLSLRGSGLERARPRDALEALRYSLNPTSAWTMRALLLLAATVTALWAWSRWPSRVHLWQGTLIVLVAFDLLGFADHFHPKMSLDSLQSAGPAAEFLQKHSSQQRVFTLWPVFDTWPNRLLPLRIADANGYSSLAPSRTETFLSQARQGRGQFLDLLNVRYIVSAKGWEPAWLNGQPQVYGDGGMSIYERKQKLDRAFVVAAARVGTPAQVMAGLTDSAFDPRQSVWLEESVGNDLTSKGTRPQSVGTAAVLEYGDERVTVKASTTAPALLVLTDAFYPGWTAYVDGHRRPIYRADYLFRAVTLPAGEHTVQFVFEPLSVRLGAYISAGAGVFTLLLLGLTVMRRQGRGEQHLR